ncbi:MAG: hypothetical protein JOZ87_40095, partial [Chloroflexi bacterium]|nr:hypothetical protein [Chloroflexota bacterium]
MRNTQDLLSHSEECELVGIYQACCANGGELTAPAAMALDALVVSHLPLVRAIARRAHRATLRSIELDDLEAAGAEGLIEGIRKFDIHRGFRLSTYVRWWIQHHVSQEVRRTTWSMGIPKNMYEAIGKFRKGFKELLIELGRGPTRAELAQFFDVNPDIDAMVYVWISPETMSLSKPVGKSSTLTVADFIEDKSQLEANGVCSEENACDD